MPDSYSGYLDYNKSQIIILVSIYVNLPCLLGTASGGLGGLVGDE